MTDSSAESPSSEDVYEKMEVLEPYTTDELAATFNAPKKRIRTVLNGGSKQENSERRNQNRARTPYLGPASSNP
jgi:hypothetical protein